MNLNITEEMAPVVAHIEETLANVHDRVLQKLINESLVKNGRITIEEAQFFNELTKKIITESSDLFIPEPEEVKELQESYIQEMEAEMVEAESKLLVDPETGDQYLYNPTTGELTPTEVEDVEEEEPAEEEMSEPEAPAGEEIPEDAEDVSASEVVQESEEVQVDEASAGENTDTIEESETASAEEEPKKELTENELLVEKLLNTVKAL